MNTAVIVPVPSEIITSRVGTPWRGAITTRETSPADTDRPAGDELAELGEPEAVEPLLQAGPLQLVDRRPQPLAAAIFRCDTTSSVPADGAPRRGRPGRHGSAGRCRASPIACGL